ncbi:hypothetical protein CLV46_1137 [Diaminobutyricimonas aerilata]|uniref:Nucleotidyltransferase AbiEii toxin of type IV toxin-antitoxin system n=1 Tax=Diaminobutyricimonas aerilata TaxID=1162967 RepID=A0A2M9CI75_9MICO|nr:hypothetical protein [Diaminobutyricimonas aerilata]PJJ71588.1 hypothetical protein CLV46_1137 [Diaminobutyricimonas aerilata]
MTRPSDEELLATADDLQRTGLEVLRALRLEDVLEAGPVRVMGSVVSGLMTWRDLDVAVCPGPHTTPRDVLAMIERVLRMPGVHAFDYRDERGDRSPAERRDERFHVPFDVVRDGATWRIDLSVFLLDPHEHVVAFHERLRDRLSPAERVAILRIKNEWWERADYPGGFAIYTAVLDSGVRTLTEFDDWLAARVS